MAIYVEPKPLTGLHQVNLHLLKLKSEYKDVESPSIYVAFKVKDGKGVVTDDASPVIWTTTP